MQRPIIVVEIVLGQGNGGATAGAIVAAGLVGGFLVSGHSAVIEHGLKLHAQTACVQTITLQLAPVAAATPVTPASAVAPAPTVPPATAQ